MSDQDVKKRGLFARVLDVVAPVVDDGKPAPEATPKPTTPNPPPQAGAPVASAPTPVATPVAPQSANADPEMYRAIMDQVEQVGAPLEAFQAQLAALAGVIPDRTALIKAAMASLAPQGITPQAVLSAIGQQRKALTEQEELFNEEHRGQMEALTEETRRVDSRQSEIDSLQEQIKRLEEQITGIAIRRTADLEAIVARQQTVESAAGRFRATVTQIQSELGSDETNIQTHCVG